MLASQLLARARRVRLTGRAPADAALTGEYRSAFRGVGLEFEEIREYAPGDDVSAIDWKVTARLGRPYVKRFREERERTVLLAVDVSRSMHSGDPPRVETAAEAAVVVAVSCAANRDRVGVLLFSDRVERFLPPGKGPGQAFAVAAALAETRPVGTGTDPGPALALLAATARHHAIVFLFSDFLGEGFASGLGRLAGRHDCIAAFVAAPDRTLLPDSGLCTVADLETGRQTLLDCGNPDTHRRFAAASQERRAQAMADLRASGASVLELPPTGPMAPALAAFFRGREQRGRAGRGGGGMGRCLRRPEGATPLLDHPNGG